MIKAARDNKIKLMATRGFCEGQITHPHVCQGGLEQNEVLYPKSVFYKLRESEQGYFYSEINCALCCSVFHAELGHSREFRERFQQVQRWRFGDAAVDAYIDGAPLKVSYPR